MDSKNIFLFELKTEIGNVKSQLDQVFQHLTNLIDEFDEQNKKLTEVSKLVKDQKSRSRLMNNLKSNLELAGTAVHDIAQPLTVLMGRCEILETVKNVQPEIIKHIEPILLSAEKIGEMIHKIRLINKGMVEQLELDFESICLEQSSHSREEENQG